MTTHVRFEQLAAAAIDFDLTRAEREQLNEHLAGCPACRATAGAYRRDAHAMREIAFVPAPAAVRAAVLGAATRSAPRVVAPWRLVAAAALLAAALVGALVAVGAWNARPTLVQTVPAPSPRGVSTPVPTLDAALPSPAPSSPVVAAQVGATCDGSLAAIAAPTVQAQVDGVHLLVENTSGQPLDFGIEDGTGLALQGDSCRARAAPTRTIWHPARTGSPAIRRSCRSRSSILVRTTSRPNCRVRRRGRARPAPLTSRPALAGRPARSSMLSASSSAVSSRRMSSSSLATCPPIRTGSSGSSGTGRSSPSWGPRRMDTTAG